DDRSVGSRQSRDLGSKRAHGWRRRDETRNAGLVICRQNRGAGSIAQRGRFEGKTTDGTEHREDRPMMAVERPECAKTQSAAAAIAEFEPFEPLRMWPATVRHGGAHLLESNGTIGDDLSRDRDELALDVVWLGPNHRQTLNGRHEGFEPLARVA